MGQRFPVTCPLSSFVCHLWLGGDLGECVGRLKAVKLVETMMMASERDERYCKDGVVGVSVRG